MLLPVRQLLSADELAEVRGLLERAPWVDGKATAGFQSAQVKRNQQVAEDSAEAKALGRVILQALGRHPQVAVGAMPLFIFPPLFNRYGPGMGFGDHVDNAVRGLLLGQSGRMRTDVSATVFLSSPEDYEGGELVVEGSFGRQSLKLAAGDAVLYPASSVHRVEPVRSGLRLASVVWIQSMIRSDAHRTLLYDLDRAMAGLQKRGLGQEPELVMLTGIYHNLLRQWLEM
jgi:PKHD-type hydroxylase